MRKKPFPFFPIRSCQIKPPSWRIPSNLCNRENFSQFPTLAALWPLFICIIVSADTNASSLSLQPLKPYKPYKQRLQAAISIIKSPEWGFVGYKADAGCQNLISLRLKHIHFLPEHPQVWSPPLQPCVSSSCLSGSLGVFWGKCPGCQGPWHLLYSITATVAMASPLLPLPAVMNVCTPPPLREILQRAESLA